MLHHLVHPTTGKQLHFGRKRPAPRPHRRFLSKYMAPGFALPPAPSVVDHFGNAPGLSDILANDALGDCTAAGALHIAEAAANLGGSPVTFTRDDAIRFYSASTGYNPADPSTDQGGDEVVVLNTWRDKGLDGSGAHAIAGWIDVDPTNVPLMRSLVFLGIYLYFGVELPNAWTTPFPSGDGYVWTPGAPNPDQGHCFVGGGAIDQGVPVDSWGLRGIITYDAVAELCADADGGALYGVLTKDILAKATQLCPTGIDWSCLVAEFDMEGGAVAAPAAP